MLRLQSSAQLLQTCLRLSPEPLSNLQNVRWARKPRHLGTAKSKLFRVPVRPKIPEDEANELKRLFNNYRNHMKSLKNHLRNEYEMATQQTVDPMILQQAFEDDLAASIKINDEWNAKIKVTREARFEAELQKELEIAQANLAEINLINEQKKQIAEETVRSIKEVASTFITRENIDKAIEKALSSVVDHNFAIDLQGNKIIGRETTPEEVAAKKAAEKSAIKQ